MDRAYLGGVEVTRLTLGCGGFGGLGSMPAMFGKGESLEEAFALMDAAWAAGIRTFDTADAYGGGRSESFIGEWIRSRGAQGLVVQTKTFNPMEEGADRGLAPARVRRQAEGSLVRLGVERIDLYLTHAWDADVPIAETAGVLEELVAEGKVGAYGLSNVGPDELRDGLAAGSFACVQNSYSLLDREAEQVVLPLCAERGVGFESFSPLAGGWLTGKYRRGEAAPADSRMTKRPEPYASFQDDAVFDKLERLEELGDPATLAVGWLLGDPRVTAIVVGPRNPAQLAPALAAVEHPLGEAERAELSMLFS